MKQKQRNEAPDDLLPELRYSVLRICLPSSPTDRERVTQFFSSYSNSIVMFGRTDLISFAHNERLFLSTALLTDKEKKDKTLASVPREPTLELMAKAFTGFVESAVLSKRKEKHKHIAQQAELKAKFEKNQKGKQKDESGQVPFIAAQFPNSFDELGQQFKFDLLIVATDYPFSGEEYQAFTQSNCPIDYFVGFEESHEQKMFKTAALKADCHSVVKEAIDIRIESKATEKSDFVKSLMETIAEFEEKRETFKLWINEVEKKPIQLTLNSEQLKLSRQLKTSLRRNATPMDDVTVTLRLIEESFDDCFGTQEAEQPELIESEAINSHFASIVPFFEVPKPVLKLKLDLMDLGGQLESKDEVFRSDWAETLDSSEYNHLKSKYMDQFLERGILVSELTHSRLEYFWDSIEFDMTAQNEWSLENKLLPDCQLWMSDYQSAKSSSEWFYECAFGKLGKVTSTKERLYSDTDSHVSKERLKIGNYETSRFELFFGQINGNFTASKACEHHIKCWEELHPIPQELITKLTEEAIAFEVAAAKAKKEKKTEQNVQVYLPESFIEISSWKRPDCSELNINFGNSNRCLAEIEPYFELSEVEQQRTDKFWFEPTVSCLPLQKLIRFGQSLTVASNKQIIKVLPSGNVLFEKDDQSFLVTTKGHVIVFSVGHQLTSVLHPNGSVSVFSNGNWTVISREGLVTRHFPDSDRSEELVSVPFLVRTRHPTSKYPFAFVREDGLQVLYENKTSFYVSHLNDFSLYNDLEKETIRIQHKSELIRTSGD